MSDFNYAKIYTSIVRSSIWGENSDTRILWITMLVLSDKDGVIRASTSGLAREANITLDACKTALHVLEGPDLDSKDQDYGGRRVERLDSGGWKVLNKAKYRDLQSPEQLAWAEKKRRQRAKAGDVPGRPGDAVSVSGSTNSDKQIHGPGDVPETPEAHAARAEIRRIGEESKRAARGA